MPDSGMLVNHLRFCVSRSEEEGLRMGLYRPWPNKENDSVMYSLLMQF